MSTRNVCFALCGILVLILSGCLEPEVAPLPAEVGDVDIVLSMEPDTVTNWSEMINTYTIISRVKWPVLVTRGLDGPTLEVKAPGSEPSMISYPYGPHDHEPDTVGPGQELEWKFHLGSYTDDWADELFSAEGTYFIRATWVKDQPASNWASVKYTPRGAS